MFFATQSADAVCFQWKGAALISVAPRQMSMKSEFRKSAYVVVARAISRRDIGDRRDIGGTEYRVVPSRILKGHPARSLVVFSENSSGRFPMDLNRDYVLFLHNWRGTRYSVDNCGYSGLVSDSARTLKQLESVRIAQ